MIRSPSVRVLVKKGFAVAVTAASTNGTSTGDVTGLGATRAMAVHYANCSGAGTTSDCKVQYSHDGGSTWTDLTKANVPTLAKDATFTQKSTTNGEQLETMDLNLEVLSPGPLALRLVHTGAGGSAAGEAYGNILLFNLLNEPVAQDMTAIDTITR